MINQDGQPICPSGDCGICGRLETGECLCKEEDDELTERNKGNTESVREVVR